MPLSENLAKFGAVQHIIQHIDGGGDFSITADGEIWIPVDRGCESQELSERLAAMTPRPDLLICHGVLAPRAPWRARVVVYGRVAPEPGPAVAPRAAGPEGPGVKSNPRAWSWAALMHRAFGIDVLACGHCGGRLRLSPRCTIPPSSGRSSRTSPAPTRGRVLAPAHPSPAPPCPDRIGSSRARQPPSCRCREMGFVLIRPGPPAD